MSMSFNVHGKQAVEFTTRGYASESIYAGAYPVVVIDFKDSEHVPTNDVTLFLSVEQLYELRKSITKAIRDTHKLKRELVVR